MEEKKEPRVITNREFINKMAGDDDIRYIVKMAELEFIRRGVADRPVWEREVVYEEWLEKPFSPADWARAHTYFQHLNGGTPDSRPSAAHRPSKMIRKVL